MSGDFEKLLDDVRACRICRDQPAGRPLPHEPRPVLRVSSTARIGVFGQAPGTRVHASGMPFTDPSGVRLRQWMGVTDGEFYDLSRVAILPMGFCFPGLDSKGADLPPRPECAGEWRAKIMSELTSLEIVLLVGGYAQSWHLEERAAKSVQETVANWRDLSKPGKKLLQFWPVPHPSWRNNLWLKKNPWFEDELIPALQHKIRRVLDRLPMES